MELSQKLQWITENWTDSGNVFHDIRKDCS